MNTIHEQQLISFEAVATLADAFYERVSRTPDAVAYIEYRKDSWQKITWKQTQLEVARWQQAFLRDGLSKGDRIAIMCANSWEWVICDQAAQGLGLVTVPLYTNDRVGNIEWIIKNSGVRALVLQSNSHWQSLNEISETLQTLTRIVGIEKTHCHLENYCVLDEWLCDMGSKYIRTPLSANDLATIVYTSGTTGRPKGVMLSHLNVLWNASAALKVIKVFPSDLLLSFLPLSHTFERTVGYYLPILAGASVAYNRSIDKLADDLLWVKPTLMISVPRIFERVYAKVVKKVESGSVVKQKLFQMAIRSGWKSFEYEQGRQPWTPELLLQPLLDKIVGKKIRDKLGGKLRFTVCGGAALSSEVSKLFISLGIPILQGYGLTETSPIIAANRLEDNQPKSIGNALPDIEYKLGNNNELFTRSPSVMLGYWNNPEATSQIIDTDGWLHTGDKVSIDKFGHITITGRIKEIIVLSNGEKVPPTDMENAIALDSLIDQVMVIGEGKPYLSAILVANPEEFAKLAEEYNLDPANEDTCCDENVRSIFMQHISDRTQRFPGYAKIREIAVVKEGWTPDNGLITPTLKLRRKKIMVQHRLITEKLYAGHS